MKKTRFGSIRGIFGALAVIVGSAALGTGVAAAYAGNGTDQHVVVRVEHMQGNGVNGSREGEMTSPQVLAA